jgi:hypothetical protein
VLEQAMRVALSVGATTVVVWKYWQVRVTRRDLAAARHALLWLWANSYLYECPPVEVSLAVKAAQVARERRS